MWRYIPLRYREDDGTWFYTVQEFYRQYGYTLEQLGIPAMGERRRELIERLEMMIKDLKKHRTKTVKEII